MKTQIYLAVVAALIVGTLPSRSSAAANILLDVPETTIKKVVQEALEDFIAEQGSAFPMVGNVTMAEAQGITVNTSRASETAVQLDTIVSFRLIIGFDIPLSAKLTLSCGFDGPALTLSSVAVGGGLPVSPEDLDNITKAANAMLDDKTSAIIEPIWRRLGNVSGIVETHQVCPRVDVRETGAIHAEFDFETGCINTDEQTTPCPRGFRGEGAHHVCRNGTWELVSRDCETTQ